MAQDLPHKDLVKSQAGLAMAERLNELEQSVSRRERELAILADISLRHHRQDNVPEILESTLDGLLSGLGLRSAWVLLEDGREGQLRLAAHRWSRNQ